MSTDGTQTAELDKHMAQDLVKEIAKERGYLGEEQLVRIGEINPELRREVEEALLRKDEMIGSAVLTLARNLYTSNARFVFELLQNADDNDYSTAVSQGQDPEDPEEDERRRDTIRLQFQDLQHTILLFLRKLRKVRVSFYDNDDVQTATTVYSLHGSNPTTIRKETSDGVEERQYHVTKHVTENIPRSENRTYSDERDRADSSTEVVLAFPLTDTGTPIVENQDVFAFLPMRPMGFKFLIHTDFVTEASRQGIVVTSLRNRALLKGIAAVSSKPSKNSVAIRHSNTNGCAGYLNETAILGTVFGRLGYMYQLRNLQSWLRDEKGDPLFTDINNEIYLAKEYAKDDLDLLKPYGLQGASPMEVILRIENDLQKPPEASIMKRSMISNDGHSSAARALMLLLKNITLNNPGPIQARLEQLRFIPLDNGARVSASRRPLYYSHSSGQLEMPRGLGLVLVAANATSNPHRRALLDKFGVIEARFRDVRLTIMQESVLPVPDTTSLPTSVSQLKFMYLSEALLKDKEVPKLLKDFQVYDHQRRACRPVKQNVYLPGDDEYGPRQLLSPYNDAPGYDVPFLHDDYLHSPPATPEGFAWNWEEWLELRLRLRRNVRLTGMDKKELTVSPLFRYI
ncbi:unnamed protein product [Fusarium graminearum]|nr:unnamed protein product [Fusarium graminearum]